jgi:dolichol kinase
MVIWQRKIYRVVMGSIFPVVYLLTGKPYLPLGLAAFFLTLLLTLEYERWKNPNVWKYMVKKFGGIFKTHPGKLTGDTWFMLSTFLLILFFPENVAIPALFFLVFGDAGSGIVGNKFGRTELFQGKTLEGFAGGLILNLIVAFSLFLSLNLSLWVMAAGAVTASVFEILPLKVNDNFSVGISAGVVMLLINLII